jgi:hypothetical protein
MAPANGTPANNGQVVAADAQITESNDTTTTYKVGDAGSVVISTATGSIVVTAIAPAAGFTSEPARTDAGGIVKVHFVSSTQRIEFIAQMVDGIVKVNVVNEERGSSGNLKSIERSGVTRFFVETNNGRAMPVKGVKGRYVRFWSNGRNIDDMNQYIEAEVYGK